MIIYQSRNDEYHKRFTALIMRDTNMGSHQYIRFICDSLVTNNVMDINDFFKLGHYYCESTGCMGYYNQCFVSPLMRRWYEFYTSRG